MSVLTRDELLEGQRLSDLRREDKKDEVITLCTCGRNIRRCTVAQKFSLYRKGEKIVHEDLTYEQIEQKYFNWLVRYGYLLVEHALNTVD